MRLFPMFSMRACIAASLYGGKFFGSQPINIDHPQPPVTPSFRKFCFALAETADGSYSSFLRRLSSRVPTMSGPTDAEAATSTPVVSSLPLYVIQLPALTSPSDCNGAIHCIFVLPVMRIG